MASQTQAAPPQPQLPVLPLLARSESESRLELAFYEDVLRVSEDDPGLRLRELDVKPGCTAGDNFSSIVMRNTALGVRGDGSPLRRSVMVKQVPQWDRFRCQAAFLKETDAYSTLVPVMRALGERAGLRLPLARCLHASRHLRPDLIILEDLADLGYSMRPRQQGLDHAHAVLVMQALGRFHGMSLSLRRLEPQLFRQLRASCKELIFFPAAEEVFSRSLTASTTMAVLSLRRSGRHDLAERLAARVARRGVFQEMCDVVLPPAEGTAVEPVFTHGDCWANNLLFKYHEDGSPREARLIDLAGIRCASPALDIQHFMSTSLPRGVRDLHRDQLLQHYIEAVKETVGDVTGAKLKPGLGQDVGGLSLESTPAVQVPEGVLSLEELRSELRQRAAFGLWIGLWMLPAVFLSPDVMSALGEPVDYFSEDTQAVLCQAMPEEFHQRLLDLVEEHASAGTL